MGFGMIVERTERKRLHHPRAPRRALFIYNGSVRGRLSGGEFVYGEIRLILRRNFKVRELILDDLLPNTPLAARRVIKRVSLAALVFISYLLYGRYDLVVTTWTPEVPFCGDIAYIQPRAGLFEVQSSRDGVLEAFGKRLLALPMHLLARVSLRRQTFITVSGFCKEDLARRFRKTSEVIYPPVKLKPYLHTEPRENLVISVGRISPEKNFEVLAEVGPKVPEARFVLVGQSAPESEKIIDKIRSSFARSNQEGNFEYEGWVSEESKERLQSTAKVFFHPAVNEPFGLVTVEAMNHGAIPVIHDSGGAKEFIPHAITYRTVEEAVSGVRRALNDWSPEIALKLHRESLRFSAVDFEKQFLQALQRTNERKARTRRTK